MENLYNFDEYVNECYVVAVTGTVQSIAFEGLFESSYLTHTEKVLLKRIILENNISEGMLNESFLDKIRQNIKIAKEKGWEIAKKVGDSAMVKLEKLAQNAKDFVNYIIEKIGGLWNWAAGKYAENREKHKQVIKAALEKSKEKLKETGAVDLKKGLANDITHLKETLGWWKKEFIGMFLDKMKTNLSSVLVKESLSWKGEALLELANFDPNKLNEEEHGKFGWLSKIVHTLAKIPPFSYLASIREKLTASFGSFLANISEATKKLGGPGVYDFAAITIILGAMAEYAVKKAAVGAAMNVIPFAGTLVHILGYVALGILFIEVVEELMKTGESVPEQPADKGKEAPAAAPAPAVKPETTA